MHSEWTVIKAQERSSEGVSGGSVVENLPAAQEMWVQSLAQADSLEKEMAIHSSILAWENSMDRSLAGCRPWGCKELDTTE